MTRNTSAARPLARVIFFSRAFCRYMVRWRYKAGMTPQLDCLRTATQWHPTARHLTRVISFFRTLYRYMTQWRCKAVMGQNMEYLRTATQWALAARRGCGIHCISRLYTARMQQCRQRRRRVKLYTRVCKMHRHGPA